jgi:hypothetical protein
MKANPYRTPESNDEPESPHKQAASELWRKLSLIAMCGVISSFLAAVITVRKHFGGSYFDALSSRNVLVGKIVVVQTAFGLLSAIAFLTTFAIYRTKANSADRPD